MHVDPLKSSHVPGNLYVLCLFLTVVLILKYIFIVSENAEDKFMSFETTEIHKNKITQANKQRHKFADVIGFSDTLILASQFPALFPSPPGCMVTK